jgi:hypothetical protein
MAKLQSVVDAVDSIPQPVLCREGLAVVGRIPATHRQEQAGQGQQARGVLATPPVRWIP